PLAMAVVFAMLPSYLLSRTLVPTLVRYLLPSEAALYRARAGHTESGAGENNRPNPTSDHTEGGARENTRPNPPAVPASRADVIWRIGARVDSLFEKLHVRYHNSLAWALGHRLLACAAFVIFCVVSFALFPFLGRDFFPSVDAGQFRLHVRAPVGTRIEETAL